MNYIFKMSHASLKSSSVKSHLAKIYLNVFCLLWVLSKIYCWSNPVAGLWNASQCVDLFASFYQ